MEYERDGIQAAKNPEQPDDALREHLDAQLREAAERKTFHEHEVERWDRVGRAASAGLVEVNSVRPVMITDPDSFMKAQEQVTADHRLG